MEETFGSFIRSKREEKNINLRKLASLLEIAPAYMSDIEKSHRYPPDRDKLDKIADILELSVEDKNKMYDLAAFARENTVSPDLPEYIMHSPAVRAALRKARDLNADDAAWEKVVEMFEKQSAE